MSDEHDGAASGDGDVEAGYGRHSRTALATQPVTRPQRPSGKRLRRRVAGEEDTVGEASTEGVEVTEEESAEKPGKAGKAKKAEKPRAAKKARKRGGPSVTPFAFVFNYLKQVFAELRKVIWPNRKQMMTYTSVVLVYLAFMITLIGLADLGLAKLVMLIFG